MCSSMRTLDSRVGRLIHTNLRREGSRGEQEGVFVCVRERERERLRHTNLRRLIHI